MPGSSQATKKQKTSHTDAAPVSNRFQPTIKLLGAPAFDAIQQAKVLVVGAGGIGCELLKNLVLTGFQHITVIDLDTIDISNLNRQFLFRRADVGKPKSTVARDAVLQYNDQLNSTSHIISLHGNIKEPTYGLEFFEKFDLVLNALDNLDARRHVNRLCITTNTPLIESGTQGYLGNVEVILGGQSECYECTNKPTPKQFAVCTIRHTPDKPIHCIVWAKWVFSALFGPEDSDNVMSDLRVHAVNSSDPSADADSLSDTAVEEYAKKLATELFDTEIQRQLEVKDRWTNRQPPVAMKVDELLLNATAEDNKLAALDDIQNQQALTPAAALLLLINSVKQLKQEGSIGSVTFDKDHSTAMNIVSTLAALRMANFNIPQQSRFSSKGIAGNIVHAIATTNAITAGLIVLQAIQLLTNRSNAMTVCRKSWISRSLPHVLQPERLPPPNKQCYVCNTDNTLVLQCNTQKFTIGQLYDRVLKKQLAMLQPSIDVVSHDNYIGLEEDHVDGSDDEGSDSEQNGQSTTPYMARVLADVKVVDTAELSIDDFAQKLQVKILVKHREDIDEEQHPSEFILTSVSGETADIEAVKAAGNEVSEQSATKENGVEKLPGTNGVATVMSTSENGEHEVIDIDADAPTAAPASSSNKRKLDATECEADAKRVKASQPEASGTSDDAIELD